MALALAAVPSEVEVMAVAAGATEEATVSAVATEQAGSSTVALVAQVEAVLSAVAVAAGAGDREVVEENSVAAEAAAGVALADLEEVAHLAELVVLEAEL